MIARELAETEKPKAGPVPREALLYFKKKRLRPSMNYTQVWQQEHTFAFTVAKLMEIDLLADVKAATEKAIEEGMTFAQWKKEAMPSLEKSGWRADASDKEGKVIPRRLAVIFETNMRVARAHGQEERAQRTKRVLPFFVFELGPSSVHREEHVSWAKTVLPVDDEWWKLHTPPLGYGCKCRKRQVSRREAEKLGGVKDAPVDEMVTWELPDGRSGEYPKGVHPSFAYPKDGKGRAAALKAASDDDPEETSARGLVELFTAFVTFLARGGSAEPKAPDLAKEAAAVRDALTEYALAKLVELVELCPRPGDRTGVHKFAGCAKVTKKYVEGELTSHGLVTRHALQKRRPLSPTPLARAVYALIKEAK